VSPEPSKLPDCRVGTSGWNYPHWRGHLYEPGLATRHWFERYCQVFDCVEINNTFYQLPQAATFDRWRVQAPAGFLYAVKANRYLTHVKRLKAAGPAIAKFLERARRLGPHLGPILYQLPPRWRRDPARLGEFLRCLPDDLTHVFEFRDPSWHHEEVFELLRARGASLCIHDMPGSECPRLQVGPVVYVRLHGALGKYQGGYPHQTLTAWARWLHARRQGGAAVWVMFNNDAEGHAIYDAISLRRKLGRLAGEPSRDRPEAR